MLVSVRSAKPKTTCFTLPSNGGGIPRFAQHSASFLHFLDVPAARNPINPTRNAVPCGVQRRIRGTIRLETSHIPKILKKISFFFVTFFLFLQLIIIEGDLSPHPTKDKEQNTPSKGQKNGLDTK